MSHTTTLVAQTELQTRFAALTAADATEDLAAQVECVRPIAQRMVMHDGIESGDLQPFYDIAGEHEGDVGDWDYFCRCVSAAYALGIAVGQQVDRDAFTSGATEGNRTRVRPFQPCIATVAHAK